MIISKELLDAILKVHEHGEKTCPCDDHKDNPMTDEEWKKFEEIVRDDRHLAQMLSIVAHIIAFDFKTRAKFAEQVSYLDSMNQKAETN